MNKRNELYGEQRIAKSIVEAKNSTSKYVIEKLNEFSTKSVQDDDVTLLEIDISQTNTKV